eukprot:UN04952
MTIEVSVHQVCCFLGYWVNFDEKELYDEIIKLINLWRKLKGMVPERQLMDDSPSDPLLLLAVQQLLILFWKTDKTNYLYESLYYLRRGLQSSSQNFQFKLLALRICCHPIIAASNYAGHIFQGLIKGVQYESLGYLITEDIIRYGPSEEFDNVLSKLNHLHSNETCSSVYDYCETAYINENYSQIGEFLEFFLRMSESFSLHYLREQHRYISFIDNICEKKHIDELLERHICFRPEISNTAVKNDNKHRFNNYDQNVCVYNYIYKSNLDNFDKLCHYPNPQIYPGGTNSICDEHKQTLDILKQSHLTIMKSLPHVVRTFIKSDREELKKKCKKVQEELKKLQLTADEDENKEMNHLKFLYNYWDMFLENLVNLKGE